MGGAIIELSGVSKRFWIPSERRHTIREHVLGVLRRRSFRPIDVLADVSLEVRAGETVGIMGANGAGKSTLLKVISQIYLPDRGSVSVRGIVTPILELGLGWNPELDAVDNILLVGTVMGMSLREARASVDSILGFAGLEQFAKLELKHYSSGMASRLAYAIAFRAVREVLVIDEILAVGDAGFKERCKARFRELVRAGHTSVLVSHDPEYVAEFCPRAILLEGGRVALEGSGSEVARAYLERLTG